MPKHYTSVDGLFGQKIHYDENGNYAGESWPGLFEGSLEHYDANGQYAGWSAPGLLADMTHHDHNGRYLGDSWSGFDRQMVHYGANGYAGESWDGLVGSNTDLMDDVFGADDDLFTSDDSI